MLTLCRTTDPDGAIFGRYSSIARGWTLMGGSGANRTLPSQVLFRPTPGAHRPAFHSAEHAGELGQDPVTSCVNDATAVFGDHRQEDGLVRLEITDGALPRRHP
jgi:hypothetical protein